MQGAAKRRAGTTSTGVQHLSVLRTMLKSIRARLKVEGPTDDVKTVRLKLNQNQTLNPVSSWKTQKEQTWLDRSTAKKQEKPVDEAESEPSVEETESEPPACLPARLPTRLSVCELTACLPACQTESELPACLPDYPPEPPVCLPVWQNQEWLDESTAQRQEVSTACLPICLPACQTESEPPTCLPLLPACLPDRE